MKIIKGKRITEFRFDKTPEDQKAALDIMNFLTEKKDDEKPKGKTDEL